MLIADRFGVGRVILKYGYDGKKVGGLGQVISDHYLLPFKGNWWGDEGNGERK